MRGGAPRVSPGQGHKQDGAQRVSKAWGYKKDVVPTLCPTVSTCHKFKEEGTTTVFKKSSVQSRGYKKNGGPKGSNDQGDRRDGGPKGSKVKGDRRDGGPKGSKDQGHRRDDAKVCKGQDQKNGGAPTVSNVQGHNKDRAPVVSNDHGPRKDGGPKGSKEQGLKKLGTPTMSKFQGQKKDSDAKQSRNEGQKDRSPNINEKSEAPQNRESNGLNGTKEVRNSSQRNPGNQEIWKYDSNILLKSTQKFNKFKKYQLKVQRDIKRVRQYYRTILSGIFPQGHPGKLKGRGKRHKDEQMPMNVAENKGMVRTGYRPKGRHRNRPNAQSKPMHSTHTRSMNRAGFRRSAVTGHRRLGMPGNYRSQAGWQKTNPSAFKKKRQRFHISGLGIKGNEQGATMISLDVLQYLKSVLSRPLRQVSRCKGMRPRSMESVMSVKHEQLGRGRKEKPGKNWGKSKESKRKRKKTYSKPEKEHEVPACFVVKTTLNGDDDRDTDELEEDLVDWSDIKVGRLTYNHQSDEWLRNGHKKMEWLPRKNIRFYWN